MKTKLHRLILALLFLTTLVEAQTTITYNLKDQSTFTNTGIQWDAVTSTTSPDGKVRTQAATTKWHSLGYGVVFQNGNSLEIDVNSGSNTIRFYGSVYSAGTMNGGSTLAGTNLGSINVDLDTHAGMADQTGYYEFNYVGGATTLYFTFSGSNAYTPSIEVTNLPVTVTLTDAWDFGATQLDVNNYNNLLNETIINAWYGAVAPGSTGINFPTSFTAGALSWVGNSGDRLRTTNTNLTRFDANVASVTDYSGRVYCNGTPNLSGGVPTNRFMRMTLNEDDEVTIIARADAAGSLTFVNEGNPVLQTDLEPLTFASGATNQIKFVAKNAGSFKIYSADGKASFYRMLRKAAIYTNVSGSIDLSLAGGIPTNYAVVFTNEAGKSWTAQMNGNGTYNANLPIGYTYTISLVNANGFIITNGTTLDLTTVLTPTFTRDITILQVTLYQVSGSITGLGTNISNLSLNYFATPASVYSPTPIINTTNGTYTVQLEANVAYTITANGVNDYLLDSNTITIPTENTTADIVFTAKPVYNVTINTNGLNTVQESNLQLTFTNLNESGYVYNFSSISGITLRNGTYTVAASGLNNYPVELGLTSNLVVNSADVSKTLTFVPVTVWSFNDQAISTTTTAVYKGMLLNGQITTVTASGHLTAKTGSTIQVPVNPGEKVSVSYYYTANFSIEGGATITTATNSTSIVETVEYNYLGTTSGYVTITVGGLSTLTSYFTEIKIGGSIPYEPIITVGVDKDYQTINEALSAVSNMIRTNTERVTIMIDPGNYEEMLVINQANVTLKNASPTPNTNIINAGVDIAPGAVRITSYYGHGYNYFSMSSDQRWNEQVLNVNTANGYISYANVGAGTTNGSYWNATVVVGANGFEAEGIIFENSFNQYISLKESQDTVQAWSTGSPGARPTNYGNTSVQNRTFVERAAAIAIKNNIDKVILNKCRVVGRQDSFFGGTGARVAVYKGDYMGAVDYIFGGMDVVFYQSKLSMNTSDQSNDTAYITAAQQTSGRGYLMYECTITCAEPLVETASVYRSKPGYFGRPWQATTSEVVFYNTTIETSNYPGFVGNSLILPLGWQNSLGGTSSGMYEFGTIENSGVNNTPNRASWATALTSPVLNDGTAITTFNFTKGNDDWDPFPQLIANEALGNDEHLVSTVKVFAYKNNVVVSNVQSKTEVKVYAINGSLIKSFETNSDANFNMTAGLWIVMVKSAEGQQSFKIITY
ncbi:pectinesterase family protein [Flavobacterium sp.]|uniref:pectinesterase family protein n=1 Tax=Flavobacterium sp. TaxID=239 RepID=UPI00391BC224